MTDKITIAGREPVILEAIGGGWCIAARDIAANLYKDGQWHRASGGDETTADEWVWPTHTAADVFIKQHADPPASAEVVESRLNAPMRDTKERPGEDPYDNPADNEILFQARLKASLVPASPCPSCLNWSARFARQADELVAVSAENAEYKRWFDGEGFESKETMLAEARGDAARLSTQLTTLKARLAEVEAESEVALVAMMDARLEVAQIRPAKEAAERRAEAAEAIVSSVKLDLDVANEVVQSRGDDKAPGQLRRALRVLNEMITAPSKAIDRVRARRVIDALTTTPPAAEAG